MVSLTEAKKSRSAGVNFSMLSTGCRYNVAEYPVNCEMLLSGLRMPYLLAVCVLPTNAEDTWHPSEGNIFAESMQLLVTTRSKDLRCETLNPGCL